MANNERIVPVPIELEMRNSYLNYSMSVIISRALPDVRDGLKPVHRRVLTAMNDLSLTHTRAYRKSAKVTGDVTGNYHPHGTTAVYDTIVRMAQEFALRYPLVDGQGNFGSVDGDPPAAERYTEVRMTAFAEEMLADLEKETDTLARYIASKPTATLKLGKLAFQHQLELGVSSAYDYVGEVMVQNMLHDEAQEGIGAFLEKRTPKWPEK